MSPAVCAVCVAPPLFCIVVFLRCVTAKRSISRHYLLMRKVTSFRYSDDCLSLLCKGHANGVPRFLKMFHLICLEMTEDEKRERESINNEENIFHSLRMHSTVRNVASAPAFGCHSARMTDRLSALSLSPVYGSVPSFPLSMYLCLSPP